MPAVSLIVGTALEDASLAQRIVSYTNGFGALICSGDDGSLCCPFALDELSQTREVIATGTLLGHDANSGDYQLTLESLCAAAATGVPPKATPPSSSAATSTLDDAITQGDVAVLEQHALSLWAALKATLPAARRASVQDLQLSWDPVPNAIHVYTGCEQSAAPTIVVSEGVLLLAGALARAQAHDSLRGTALVRNLPGQVHALASGTPLAELSQEYRDAADSANVRAFQHAFFDSQLLWLLAHELGHHVLGHQPCAAQHQEYEKSARVDGCVRTHFSVPFELEADDFAATTLLDAARRGSERGQRWNEEGALSLLWLFSELEKAGPDGVTTTLQRAQLPPKLRARVLRAGVRAWRAAQRAK